MTRSAQTFWRQGADIRRPEKRGHERDPTDSAVEFSISDENSGDSTHVHSIILD
jgi:hypothetical protein